MTRRWTTRSRGLGPFLASLVLASLAVPAGAGLGPAVAAGTEFGTPAATATWGQGVVFSEPAVLPTTPLRVEAVVESGGSDTAFVSELPTAQRAGSTVFTYTLDAATGGVLPNTPFTARWRVTYPDGTVDLGPPVTATYADTRFQWRTIAGPVVRVHWYEGSDAFGRQALRIAEDGIAKASAVLGTSDRAPVDFYVYADQAALLDALGPGTREWVGGTLDPETRTLFATIAPDEIGSSSVDAEIPHELTHLVFDTAVQNPYHVPPRWFDEGLAVYLSQGYDAGDRDLVRTAVDGGGLMPLSALGGEFPTTSDRAALAYAESVSALDFLVRTHGPSALERMVTAYAAGGSDDEAFRAALGTDVAGFQAAWLKDLGAASPERYGPNSPPPGPLPAGWSGPAAGGPAAGGPGAGSGGPAATPGAARGPSGGTGGIPPIGIVALAAAAVVVVLFVVTRRRPRPARPAPESRAAALAPQHAAEAAEAIDRVQTVPASPGDEDRSLGAPAVAPGDEPSDIAAAP